MKITKYGHCCLFVEEQGLRILIDPGMFTEGKHPVENIDVLLITHEHQDHCHVPSVQTILKNSPQAKVYTITAGFRPMIGAMAQKLLTPTGINVLIPEDGVPLEF